MSGHACAGITSDVNPDIKSNVYPARGDPPASWQVSVPDGVYPHARGSHAVIPNNPAIVPACAGITVPNGSAPSCSVYPHARGTGRWQLPQLVTPRGDPRIQRAWVVQSTACAGSYLHL